MISFALISHDNMKKLIDYTDESDSVPVVRFDPAVNRALTFAIGYDTHFGKLRELSKGETVIFTDMEGIVSTYCVEKLETLSPDAVDTVLNSGYDLVLYTCTKGGRTRGIVFCDRAAETASSSAPRQTEK